jgi:hypothetical protein
VGSIKEEVEASLFGDFGQCIDIASVAPDVNADDPGSSRCDEPFDLLGVNAVGLRVDIREYRRYFLPLKGMSSCDERERRHDYLAFECQSAYR